AWIVSWVVAGISRWRIGVLVQVLRTRPRRAFRQLQQPPNDEVQWPALAIGKDVPLVEQGRDAENDEDHRPLNAVEKEVAVHWPPPDCGGGGGGGSSRVRLRSSATPK